MIDIDELRWDAKHSYRKRFTRWLAKSDIEKQIKIAAKKGRLSFVIDLKSGNYSNEFVEMANDRRFIPLLNKAFPGFDILRDDSDFRDLFGFKHTRNKVVLCWE